jgi:hypothetical protein
MDDIQVLILLVIVAVFLALLPELIGIKRSYILAGGCTISLVGAIITITDATAKNRHLSFMYDGHILQGFTRRQTQIARENTNGSITVNQMDETEALYK